jgi:serine/threonine-protein kinase RsbW
MTASRSFPRRIDALEQLFDFTAQVLPDGSVSAALRRSVDFVLEEYFTNIVKYGGGQGPIGIDIDLSATGVEVAVTEPDAHFFDVTRVPAIDTTLPIGERQPGGLGLYLARRMVDTLRYDYAPEERLGRITFTIGIPPASAGQNERSRNAVH